MTWQFVRAFSMSVPDQWFPLNGQVLFCNYDGVFQLKGQNELSFWAMRGIDRMAANLDCWAFQIDNTLLFGPIDQVPQSLLLPQGYLLSVLEATHSILHHRGRFYLFAHVDGALQLLPRGCKYPKISN